jgi:G3E family GTPase
MVSIENKVKNINGLAALIPTSFAQISTDLVLDINCYSTNSPDRNLEFDMKQGLITGKMCVPCNPNPSGGLADSSDLKNKKNKKNEKNEEDLIPSLPPKHSASTLSTCSITFHGKLDIQKLNVFLDNILFGNGSRVGGGYRQASITYVNLLDKESSDGPLVAPERGSDEVVVYTSAPKVVKVETKSHESILDSKEMKIFRMKGVLHVENREYLQVLQAVFDIFEVISSSFLIGSEGDLSTDLNRVVVIGRNIDSDEIEKGFLSCLIQL